MTQKKAVIPKRKKLSSKLILIILMFLLFVAVTSGSYIISSEKQLLSHQLDSQGQSLANATAIFSVEPLLVRDYPVLDTFVESMAEKKHDVISVSIFRKDGQLVAGKSIQDKESSKFLRSYQADIIQDNLVSQDSIGKVEIVLSSEYSELVINQRIWALFIVTTLSFLILGISIYWLIKREVERPLGSLSIQADQLGKGDLKSSIKLNSKNELDLLANTLDSMRLNLESTYIKIEKQNKKLKTLDKMKDSFMAKISHELNTPLNGIIGLTNAILETENRELDTETTQAVHAIKQSGERLLELANQILSFKQISESVAPLASCNVSQLIRELMDQYKPKITANGLKLMVQITDNLELTTNRQSLKTTLDHILDNAIKFTKTGLIKVHLLEIEQTGLGISIYDTGIGINKELHELIFESFEQGFSHEDRAYEGAGIGLYQVQELLSQINGAVHLISTPGKGSCFTVILPYENNHSADDLARQWARSTTIELPNSDSKPLARPSQRRTGTIGDSITKEPSVNMTTGTTATVLVVDDDSTNRIVAKQSLQGEYRIIEAADGNECLEILDKQEVDLVLLDLMMPVMSGFEVLEHLQKHPEKHPPKIIVVSALIDTNTISRTLRLGASDYLKKPFHIEEMKARVRTQISLEKREWALEDLVQKRTKQLEKANARLEETFRQLLQSEKMASIGQLAAGVAHEINNPIGFIHSNLYSLKEYTDHFIKLLALYQKLETTFGNSSANQEALISEIRSFQQSIDLEYLLADLPDLLEDTLGGTNRVKDIVQSLKSFSRIDSEELEETDINAGIEATLKVVSNELKYKCEVLKSLDDLPLLRSHPGQLNQVFTNILVNAAQAIETRGTINITTKQVKDEIIIQIADDGPGIKQEHKSRLFDPFFSTKPVGEGTGLGLYLSYEIIEKHGGNIEVDSEEGKGTTFTITLPIQSDLGSDH